ncbi:VPA1262 family protein [Pseudoduganella aquatica]|uniref:VPA1262 family protein n=1 Tax=Pseudoduganella aquatica TaxID=2660641 RepID=UPI001CB712F1|nr:VPA1262 family protein [Pseudoduganella aquatica]
MDESMAVTLNDLLNDRRLARLFSMDARHCALQLWILQIKSDQLAENRIVYGRLLPYSHSSNSWSFSDNDDFNTFGKVRAKVTRLNLYVKSDYCSDLLRLLSAGQTISAISEELKFRLPEKLRSQFGEASLVADNLVYRPVAYLLNRDAYDWKSISSPHGGAGAFSASITPINKRELFQFGEGYDLCLTASVVKYLNADTGLEFGGIDAVRFGDIELLVFPALDDMEKRLLSVSWVDDSCALVARFNPSQVPNFSGFHFRLCVVNDAQIIYSGLGRAERDAEGVFEYKFVLGDQLRARMDSSELEIFGLYDDNANEGALCCRWRIGYIREINFQGHMLGHGGSPVKFDWLEKTTRPSVSQRVKAALTINRGDAKFGSEIGGRKADPWVPVNRDLASLFTQIHPPKSDGQFFPRWGQEEGDGRLQFVEWFKTLLEKFQKNQIIIFDPYFETAGLGLVLLCAAPQADYVVFTSLPKSSKNNEAKLGESDLPNSGRVNNLVASCEHHSQLLKRIKFRIYGMKEGRLHDRYILIMGAGNLPIAGFNLSNSFQKAAENYPLLITPIPADVLIKVEQYKAGLMKEATTALHDGDIENPTMRLLFDSTLSSTVSRRYEPLRFLENSVAGDVLSVWCCESSLKGLAGEPLKAQMTVLGLLKDDSLALSGEAGLNNCLENQAGAFDDFAALWEVLGEVLAHSHVEEWRFREFEFSGRFLDFLARYLEEAFKRKHDEADNELAVVDAKLFRESIEVLMLSSYNVGHLFRPVKYAALTWSEYYAVKFLWWHSPASLLMITETQVAAMPIEPVGSDAVRLSLLSQIVSDISLSVQFGVSEIQRECLTHSSMGLLQWLGLSAIEGLLEKPGGLEVVLQLLSTFAYSDRVRAMGWMVHHVAKNSQKIEIYGGLVTALHDALPVVISADELAHLINSMRGHMVQLAWAEPWLFQDVVFPLLKSERANCDDACEIWVQELASMLEPKFKCQSHLFSREREGQTTNIAAFLFAYSTPDQQRDSLKSIKDILKRQQRIVQQPLASTSDWTRWDGALTASLWLLSFCRWGEFYLRQRDMVNNELEQLSKDARVIAMVRPVSEWQVNDTGRQGELAAFLNQVEDLLVSSSDSKSGKHHRNDEAESASKVRIDRG